MNNSRFVSTNTVHPIILKEEDNLQLNSSDIIIMLSKKHQGEHEKKTKNKKQSIVAQYGGEAMHVYIVPTTT